MHEAMVLVMDDANIEEAPQPSVTRQLSPSWEVARSNFLTPIPRLQAQNKANPTPLSRGVSWEIARNACLTSSSVSRSKRATGQEATTVYHI